MESLSRVEIIVATLSKFYPTVTGIIHHAKFEINRTILTIIAIRYGGTDGHTPNLENL